MQNRWRVGVLLAMCVGSWQGLSQAPEALKPYLREDAPVLVLEHVRLIDGTGDAARDDQRVVIDHNRSPVSQRSEAGF